MILTHAEARGPIDDACDYAIVGSGAAGATAARVLAEAGADVVVLEEGPPFPPGERTPALYRTMKRVWRDMGTSAAAGRSMIPILQGCGVGGTTLINAAICWRMPEEIHALWREDPGVARALPYSALERAWDRIEAELGIRPVGDAILGGNNGAMERGCAALGIPGRRIERNEAGCEGSGRCVQGCPGGRKLSMDLSYLPRAMTNGARVYAGCRADRILTERRRAVGVAGVFHDAEAHRDLHPVTIHARRGVILAASAVQTPALLLRNKLANRSRQVGRNFQCHPGVGVVGLFDEDVKLWRGATQGYESAHFWGERFKLESLGLPIELAAARLPGVGRELARNLADLRRMTLIGVQVRARAKGVVTPIGARWAAIRYSLTDADVETFRKGLRVLCEITFAAGAKEVLPGVTGLPERMRSPDELRAIDAARLHPRAFSAIATHLFGTARMGSDPNTSVVKPTLETHDVDGLHVLDSSVFPTNLGVNPQHSIMAMAWVAAERLANA